MQASRAPSMMRFTSAPGNERHAAVDLIVYRSVSRKSGPIKRAHDHDAPYEDKGTHDYEKR